MDDKQNKVAHAVSPSPAQSQSERDALLQSVLDALEAGGNEAVESRPVDSQARNAAHASANDGGVTGGQGGGSGKAAMIDQQACLDEENDMNKSASAVNSQRLPQEEDFQVGAADDRVHSMGERASTTSSIFHHNMFFMNNDFDRQDVVADPIPRRELALSPLKALDDVDHSASGGGFWTAAGNTEGTNKRLNLHVSSQQSEGHHLLLDSKKLQEQPHHYTDTRSQGQYQHGSTFKFEGFYHNGFDAYSEIEPRSLRHQYGQSVGHQSQGRSPPKAAIELRPVAVSHSVEKAFERSERGSSNSKEAPGDFPPLQLDFLTHEPLETEVTKINGRTQERRAEDAGTVSPIVPLQEGGAAVARSHFALSFHRAKWNTSQDNDNKSSGSVDRAMLLNKVPKAGSNQGRRRTGKDNLCNLQLMDVNFMAAQQLGNNQFSIKGLKSKEQVRCLLEAFRKKNIKPLAWNHFNETVILDLKNFSDCQLVRRALNELKIGVKSTSENPDFCRPRRVFGGQELELIMEKENDNADWSNSDAEKSLSDKNCDIPHKGRSNSRLRQLDIKDSANHFGLHLKIRSPTEKHNAPQRRFKHSQSQVFAFNKLKPLTHAESSIASFRNSGGEEYQKLRATSSHQFLSNPRGQEVLLQRQQAYALSRRSDSLKSHNLLQTFKSLNELDDEGGKQTHGNVSDYNIRNSLWNRPAAWKGAHASERAGFEQQASPSHHQRPESCNNCYTRVHVINLRPMTGAAANGVHLTAGRAKDCDETASDHSYRKPICTSELGDPKLKASQLPNFMTKARQPAQQQRPDSELRYSSTHLLNNKGVMTPRSQQVPYIKNQLNLNNQGQRKVKISELCSALNTHQANSTGHHRNSIQHQQQKQGAPSVQSSDSAVLSYIQPLNQHGAALDIQFQKSQVPQQKHAPPLDRSSAQPEPSAAIDFSSMRQQPYTANIACRQVQQQPMQTMNFQQLLMYHQLQQQQSSNLSNGQVQPQCQPLMPQLSNCQVAPQYLPLAMQQTAAAQPHAPIPSTNLMYPQTHQMPNAFAMFASTMPSEGAQGSQSFTNTAQEELGRQTMNDEEMLVYQKSPATKNEDQNCHQLKMAKMNGKAVKAGKHVKNTKVKKKVLVGPKNNKIDLMKILRASQCAQTLQRHQEAADEDDEEVLSLTTLMIKNIPVKFLQGDMLKLIDKNFMGKYDYFYLPMDLKTQCSVGFAFINMLHPLYILDFYLEFQQIHWSDHVPLCNSTKYGEIVYANVQGIEQIKQQLYDKNIMKKNDQNIKPIFHEQFKADPAELEQVQRRYLQDQQFIQYYRQRLQYLENISNHLSNGNGGHKHRNNKAKNGNRSFNKGPAACPPPQEEHQKRKTNKWQGNHGMGKRPAPGGFSGSGLHFQLNEQVQLHHLGEAFAQPPQNLQAPAATHFAPF